jgi:hypothetical protein
VDTNIRGTKFTWMAAPSYHVIVFFSVQSLFGGTQAVRIQYLEVKEDLKRIEGGKALCPGDVPIEEWRCLTDMAMLWLTKLFNNIFRASKIPEEWRKSIFSTLSSRVKEIFKVVLITEELNLRRVMDVTKKQFGFIPGNRLKR